MRFLVDAIRAARAADVVHGDLEALTLAAQSMHHRLATLFIDGPDRSMVTAILLLGMVARN